MTVSGIPPRVPTGASKLDEPEKLAEKVVTGPVDRVQRSHIQKPAMSPRAGMLPTFEPEGEPRPVRARDAAPAQVLGPAQVPTLPLSQKQIAAAFDLHELLALSLLDLPPTLEDLVSARVAMARAPLAQVADHAWVQKLSGEGRAALSALGRSLSPVFSGLTRRAVPRKRLHALRRGGKRRIERDERLEEVEPEELRELLFELHGEAPSQESRNETGARDAKPIESVWPALAQQHEIILPALDVIALEAAFQRAWPHMNVALDEDGRNNLAVLLMMECAAGSEESVGHLIDAGRALSDAQRMVRALPENDSSRAKLEALEAESDALAERIELQLARRACFVDLVRAWLARK
jgi:hypothetical protein